MVGGVERSCSKNLERRRVLGFVHGPDPNSGDRGSGSNSQYQASHFENAWTRRRRVRFQVRHRTGCKRFIDPVVALCQCQHQTTSRPSLVASPPGNNPVSTLCARRRIDRLWAQFSQLFPPCRRHGRQNSAGSRPCRNADRPSHKVRVRLESQDGSGAWYCHSTGNPAARRRRDRMRRREFITLGGAAAAWPLAARAQAKRARVGWFTVAPHPYLAAFRRGLRELGWIEGENLLLEETYADGHPERLPGLAAVLARVPYDLVVASGSDVVEAARAAIQSTPIVAVSSTLGLGGSLARSAGNLS